MSYFIGLDVGTQGARAVACDPQGRIIAHREAPLDWQGRTALPEGWAEQDPASWWTAACASLRTVTAAIDARAVAAVSVTSTSGTVCLLDAAGDPIGPALMYNDGRAQAEATEVQEAGAQLAAKLGCRFVASFALPKLLWLKRHVPAAWATARHFLSPTDFIIGRLGGDYAVTDYSNALKTGYDLIDGNWPDFIETLGVPRAALPRVVAPGTVVAQVTPEGSAATGLLAGTPLVTGMTDGCASQVSTGAIAPGQWNSTLGTTLVLKGVTRAILRDPEGRVYCHRHPDGFWLPGGASNTGGEAITRRFASETLASLNAGALECAPTDLLVYPLARTGERFPFVAPSAQGFMVGDASSQSELYTAYLEGTAYVERLAYQVLVGLGAEVGDCIHAAGGANSSSAWLQLRSDILGRTLLVPEDGGAAKGAAVIAAGAVYYGGIVPAAGAMVRIGRQVTPRPEVLAGYDERYARFCAELRNRGYLVD